LYVGNPDGVQTGKSKKRSKKINQKLSNWSFGSLYEKLEYKGKLHGIEIERIEESYTSGTCPNCLTFKKQKGRTFTCPKCKAIGHRDCVGAVNILDKATHKGTFTSGRSLPRFEDTTYLRVRLRPVGKQWSSGL
jgi:putative transposase